MGKIKLAQTGEQVQSDLNFTEKMFTIYDASSTYAKDNVVRYGDKLYKCKNDNTTGTWDSSKWEEIKLGQISAKVWNLVEAQYTYDDIPSEIIDKWQVGDIVLLNDGTFDYSQIAQVVEVYDESKYLMLLDYNDNLGSGKGVFYIDYEYDNGQWAYTEQERIPFETGTKLYQHTIYFDSDDFYSLIIINNVSTPYTTNTPIQTLCDTINKFGAFYEDNEQQMAGRVLGSYLYLSMLRIRYYDVNHNSVETDQFDFQYLEDTVNEL